MTKQVDSVRALLEVAVSAERERIRKAQAGALRNLRVLLAPECDEPDGCCHGAEDCERGMFLRELRDLRAATRRPE